jgi:hypothetical protein
MKKSAAIFLLIFMVSVVMSCRLLESLSGGDKEATVDALWPDVPPFAGATKTDLKLPLGVRLILRAAMQGKVNFIAFTTDKNPEDVQNFYTNERMKAAGWMPNNNQGCTGDTEGKNKQGISCFFTRKGTDKQEMLAIIVAQDDKKKDTNIFYARIDVTQATPTPTP